jgi:xanthine dehydrogenase YagR molybdenum-binding subunit
MRLANLPGEPRKSIYEKEIALAVKRSDWANKWHAPGKGKESGPIKHGIGMALHTWGGAGRGPNDVRVTISSDGSVLVESSTQDLGTGERTVLPIVVAEVLGLEVKDITTRVGESTYGRSTGSGGSTTCPGTAPAALNAATTALSAFFKKVADKLGAQAENLVIEPGKVVDKVNKKNWAW